MDNQQKEKIKRARKVGLFNKDLKNLMYAFGDDQNPSFDSVNVLEDILVDYISEMVRAPPCPSLGSLTLARPQCHEASRIAGPTRSKVKMEDFKYALRNDSKKLGRVEQLLAMNKEIAEARKMFDDEPGAAKK
ncbi:hypothetical protein G7K_5078-t1 [Saitoella complicata NRRL Y-17804]|uniref:Transcription initiation factor TFIID subunit 13 n=1 Tax=Saitoella complicata (strain BCRC 22490 / CBS 7301 / JCM 7358 / NBRC 10748 / NRRL Y-17804) TaxID=698492 RepID=A0A0E9NM60_SAICN|nr:hypothetical protein G7K_5078-t1 [Saitoella complicata NRRL Y-17804]